MIGPAQPSITVPEMPPPTLSMVLVSWKAVVWKTYLKADWLTELMPKALKGTQLAYLAAVAAWVAA